MQHWIIFLKVTKILMGLFAQPGMLVAMLVPIFVKNIHWHMSQIGHSIYIPLLNVGKCAKSLNRQLDQKEMIMYNFYLAGPMRGYPKNNAPLFNKAANSLRDKGYTVFSPAEVNDETLSFEQCMKIDINAIVNECATVALLPGWRESIGANIEVFVAFACGKRAYEIDLDSNPDFVVLTPVQIERFNRPYQKQYVDQYD